MPSKKRKQMSSFPSDSSSEEEKNTDPYEAGKKTHRRQTWIQEDDEPVDLLDRTVVKKILSEKTFLLSVLWGTCGVVSGSQTRHGVRFSVSHIHRYQPSTRSGKEEATSKFCHR